MKNCFTNAILIILILCFFIGCKKQDLSSGSVGPLPSGLDTLAGEYKFTGITYLGWDNHPNSDTVYITDSIIPITQSQSGVLTLGGKQYFYAGSATPSNLSQTNGYGIEQFQTNTSTNEATLQFYIINLDSVTLYTGIPISKGKGISIILNGIKQH